MEDVDFKGENEGDRVLDEIDDMKYSDLPMDWDPNVDLLESFEPNYLEDKTFDINSRIFKRCDGVHLITINVRKRNIRELTDADVNAKTKGYAEELYENLTFVKTVRTYSLKEFEFLLEILQVII